MESSAASKLPSRSLLDVTSSREQLYVARGFRTPNRFRSGPQSGSKNFLDIHAYEGMEPLAYFKRALDLVDVTPSRWYDTEILIRFRREEWPVNLLIRKRDDGMYEINEWEDSDAQSPANVVDKNALLALVARINRSIHEMYLQQLDNKIIIINRKYSTNSALDKNGLHRQVRMFAPASLTHVGRPNVNTPSRRWAGLVEDL